jgi:hypothetical protein
VNHLASDVNGKTVCGAPSKGRRVEQAIWHDAPDTCKDCLAKRHEPRVSWPVYPVAIP